MKKTECIKYKGIGVPVGERRLLSERALNESRLAPI